MSAIDTLQTSIKSGLAKLAIPSSGGTVERSIVVDGVGSTVSAKRIVVNGVDIQNIPAGPNTVNSAALQDNIELGTLPTVVGCAVKVTWIDEYDNVLDTFEGICAQNLHYHIEPNLDPVVWNLQSSALDQVITGALTKTIQCVLNTKPVNVRFNYLGETAGTIVFDLYIGQKFVLNNQYETVSTTAPFVQVGHRLFWKTIDQHDIDHGIDIECYDKREVEFYNISSWKQPTLTSNTTSTADGNVVCSASSEYIDSREESAESNLAFHAMDGVKDGYSPSTFWGPGTYGDPSQPENFGAWWQVKYPYKLLIKSINVYNRYSGSATEDQTYLAGAFYTDSSKSKMIGKYLTGSHKGLWWQTPVPSINSAGVVTDTLFFFKEDDSSDWAGIGEIELHAFKVTPATHSNHNFVYVTKQY